MSLWATDVKYLNSSRREKGSSSSSSSAVFNYQPWGNTELYSSDIVMKTSSQQYFHDAFSSAHTGGSLFLSPHCYNTWLDVIQMSRFLQKYWLFNGSQTSFCNFFYSAHLLPGTQTLNRVINLIHFRILRLTSLWSLKWPPVSVSIGPFCFSRLFSEEPSRF